MKKIRISSFRKTTAALVADFLTVFALSCSALTVTGDQPSSFAGHFLMNVCITSVFVLLNSLHKYELNVYKHSKLQKLFSFY